MGMISMKRIKMKDSIDDLPRAFNENFEAIKAWLSTIEVRLSELEQKIETLERYRRDDDG